MGFPVSARSIEASKNEKLTLIAAILRIMQSLLEVSHFWINYYFIVRRKISTRTASVGMTES